MLKRFLVWVEDITGFWRSLGPMMTHPVPPARKTRWFYVFGSATLVAFLIQVVTGIALASGYVTGSGQAYDSLRFISTSELGRIIRGIHYFGASAMIILPFVGSRGERIPWKRPWSILIVLFAMATIAYYGRLGILAPWLPRMEAPPLPASVVGVTTGPVAEGAKVFYDKGCEYCHTVSGGIRGPNLTDAGDRLTAQQMETRIFSGAANTPSYAGNLSPAQLQALVAFLSSRHLPHTAVPPPARRAAR